MMRYKGRAYDELRPIRITREFTQYAEGSVLIEYGLTRVLCNVSVIESVPKFLKGKNQGWLTAEYGMLPRATHSRCDREALRGKQSGRTQEIQRLIGRCLRAVVDLKKLADMTFYIDCDVLQADGGTRTAAITGSCVAIVEALRHLQRQKTITTDPLIHMVAAVSVGIHQDQAILDLDYQEDANASTDMNVIMNEHGDFIEIQGTAEKGAFSQAQQQQMLQLAKQGIAKLIERQKLALIY